MLVLANDAVIGRSLTTYGEWAEHELAHLRPHVPDGGTVVDVGANVGTHTLAFAKWAGEGRVVAIEAQPLVCGILAANCLLNDCRNVEVVNAVCAKREGWVSVEVECQSLDNVGGVSLAGET